MSAVATAWAWRVPGVSSTERLVVLALADGADDQNLTAVSREQVMALTGLSETTVRRAIAVLQEQGAIVEHDDVIRRDVASGQTRLVPRYLLVLGQGGAAI